MRHLRSKACALQVGEKQIAALRELFKKSSAKKYNKSEKGAARHKAYEKSEKGAARQAAYDKSEKGAARKAAYDKSKKGAARQAAYDKSEKGAAREATRKKSEKGAAAHQQNRREEETEKERQNYQKGAERFRKHMDYDDNVTQLVRTAKKMKLVTEEDRCLDFQEATLLSEDFLCATNTLTSQLLKDGSEQLVKEATEIMGRLIDSLLQ